MQKIKNAVAACGKYINAQGEEKTSWVRCGSLFNKGNNEFVLKLDAVPTGEFDGWINFFDLPDSNNIGDMGSKSVSTSRVEDDNIPF